MSARQEKKSHLASALSEGGGGNAERGNGGSHGLLHASGDLEAVGLHGHGCTPKMQSTQSVPRIHRAQYFPGGTAMRAHEAGTTSPPAPHRKTCLQNSTASGAHCHPRRTRTLAPSSFMQYHCLTLSAALQMILRICTISRMLHRRCLSTAGELRPSSSSDGQDARAHARHPAAHRPWRSGAACGRSRRAP